MPDKKTYDLFVFWATVLIYCCAFVFFLMSYSGCHIARRYINSKVAYTLYPIKWDYYTTGAITQKTIRLYKVENGKAVYVDTRPFAPQYSFGLSCLYKLIVLEMCRVVNEEATVTGTSQYTATIPAGADINSCIRTDTLRYNNYHSQNVRYLSGRYIITTERALTWQQQRTLPPQPTAITVLPVNIDPAR